MQGNDFLSTDNEQREKYSASEAAGDIKNIANAESNGKKLDDFLMRFNNGSNKTPNGHDLNSDSLSLGKGSSAKGADIATKGADIGSNSVNAASKGAEIGSNAAAKGVELGTTAAAKGAEIGSNAATSVGTVASSAGATASTAGTIAAEGGAAVVAGAPTAGIGTLVVAGISILNMGAKMAKKAIKNINMDIDEILKNKSSSSIGIGGKLTFGLFILALFLCVFIVPIFTPQAVFSSVVNSAVEKVNNEFGGTIDSYTEKGKFFRELFEADELEMTNGELYDIYSSQEMVDSNNVAIYMAIIDKGIENAYNEYIKRYAMDPENIFKFTLSSICEKIGGLKLTRFSAEAAELYLREQPYFYSLPHNQVPYTVGEYLDKSIPKDDLNNDINYAEIISVYSQKENENGYFVMSYSDFYDSIAGKDHAGMFFEMQIATEPTFFYWNNEDHTSFTEVNSWTDAWLHRTQAQDEEEKNSKSSSDDSDDDSSSEDSEDTDETLDSDDESLNFDEKYSEISEEDGGNYGWGYFYKVTLYPYGLDEIYKASGVDCEAPSKINSNLTNKKCLNYQEGFLRAYLGNENKLKLGPSYLDERNTSSLWYPLMENGNIPTTGRTPRIWILDSVTNYDLGYLESLCGDNQGIIVDYHPTGEAVILDFHMDNEFDSENRYICQGDYPVKRGDGKGKDKAQTIANSGCIDCSYTMAAQYYNRTSYDITKISKLSSQGGYVINGNSFFFGKFCEDMGITRGYGSLSSSSIVSSITQGNPVVVQIKGVWKDYHKSSSTHFFLIIGYDDKGFYLADPGSRNNTRNGPIPYSDFAGCPIVDIDYLSKPGTIPQYKINTILGVN